MPQRSDVVYRSALADRLAAQSLQPQQRPILSTGEGLANMGTMWAQALGARNIREGVNEDNAAKAQALAKALSGGDANKESQLAQAIGSDPAMLSAAGHAYFKALVPDRSKPKDNLMAVGDRVFDVSSGTPREVVAGMPKPSKTREVKRDGKIVTEEFDPATGWKQIASSPQFKPEDGGIGGPFKGNAMDAQATNILLTGDPSTPVYQAAYAHLAQPKVSMDPNTGTISTISPDMSAFQKPAPRGQAPSAPVPSVSAPPMPGAPAVAADTAVRVPGATITQTPGAAPGKFNDTQGKAAGFADRMAAASDILSKFDKEGASLVGRNLENIWGGNYLQSDAYQQFEQARRDFTNAVLRRESGAVINPDEFANADRQYFPQPGDSPAVIAQKANQRRIALESMRRDAGPSYKPSAPNGAPATGNIPAPPPGFTIMGQ